MWFNPFLDQRLVEEWMKDAHHEAEQARLIRRAEGARRVREGGWRRVEGWRRLLGATPSSSSQKGGF